MMSSAASLQRENRGARVKLGGTVLAIVQLQNRRQIRSKLHQLSVNGGLLHLEQPLAEGIRVELLFHVGNTTVRNQVEMLFPMWATRGCLQPFRFKDMNDALRGQLEAELKALLDSSPSSIAEDNNIP
jgi:hypothetical protein